MSKPNEDYQRKVVNATRITNFCLLRFKPLCLRHEGLDPVAFFFSPMDTKKAE